ncbi:MAG: hypothetical protein LKF52_07160 [Butyrivibrio sp.]|jgi:hypothetical protein|nr:hypothetical protein [Butyrivibrio sp.]
MKIRQFCIRYFRPVSLAVSLMFYLMFAVADGPVWCKDSYSYATMGLTREPFYPLYLAFFRRIFGEQAQLYGQPVYLFPAILGQSILWAFAAWSVGILLYEEYGSRNPGGKAVAAGWTGILLQFAVPLLNRFAAIRGSMYSECIMTESLAMPLYVLLGVQMYRWVRRHRRRDLVLIAVSTFLLISIRKQMAIGLLLFLCISCLYDVLRKNSRNMKRFLYSILLAGLVVLMAKGFDYTYNYLLRGVWMEHTGNSKAELCTLIFSADENDAALFDTYGTPDEKAMFEEIMSKAKAQQLLIGNVPEKAGWVTLAEHYADSYDVIGFDVAQPVIREYITSHYDLDEIHQELKLDEISSEIVRVLWHQDKKDLLRVYGANLIKGFVCSDARVMPVLNEIGILIYVIFLMLYAAMVRRKQAQLCLFSEIAFGGILINTVVVGALIFPQPRYMTYGMGLFYAALILMMERLRKKDAA